MRKIFLDIGGWNGKSSIFFRENHPEGDSFEIFMFECDKQNIESIKSKNLKITLIEKAAWCFNKKVKYYYGNNDGGSLYSTKKTGKINPKNFYEVDAIDLAEFIINNFNKDDYIIIKMNCEGAEYELIPHLQKNNIIDWINKWYIQWHWSKIGLDELTHNNIKKLIPKSFEWECQTNEQLFITKFKQSLLNEE